MESGEPEQDPKCAKFFLLPQRYIIGIMTSLALVNAYTMRISLSMAITEMVPYKSVASLNKTGTDEGCPEPEHEPVQTVKNTDVLYDWTEKEQGLILSSFYWGYLVTHLPGGVISEYYGGKHVLGIGIFINAFATLVSPAVITGTQGSVAALTVLRVIEGAGQGPVYPAINAIMGQWVPLNERAFIVNIAFSGAFMGTILGNLISGLLIGATHTWTVVFYFFGVLGLIWNVLWQLLCYSRPTSHPCVKVKEKEHLKELMAKDVSWEKKKVPWKPMLTSLPMWALVAAQFGHDWGWFTLVTDLPKYMKSVLKFNVKENAMWSSLPYAILFIVNILMGKVADWTINKGYFSVTFQRKFFTTIGAMGPAIFVVLAAYVGCNKTAAVAMFTLSVMFHFGFFCGTKVNAIDLAPNFSGTLMAIVNGLGVIAGMIAPALVGIVAQEQTLAEWATVFWITFAVFAVTNLIFLIFGTGNVQKWNNPDEEN